VTGPLPLDQPDLVRRLRDALASAQFTADKIGDALGTGDEIVSRASDIPVQLRHLEQHATIGALVRLLILALDVPIAQLARRSKGIPAVFLIDLSLEMR
jgi:hypothetical protein